MGGLPSLTKGGGIGVIIFYIKKAGNKPGLMYKIKKYTCLNPAVMLSPSAELRAGFVEASRGEDRGYIMKKIVIRPTPPTCGGHPSLEKGGDNRKMTIIDTKKRDD